MSSLQSSDKTKSSCNSCTSSVPQSSTSIEGDWVEEGAYKRFSAGIQSTGASKRIPLNGTIEIIENCNFRCIHCYQGQNKAKTTLSGQEWCKIIDQLAENGTLWLLITGGEPLLHPDFEMIYTHAIKAGMILNLFTNGRLIQERHLNLFKKYPPFAIEITLYGASEEMYSKVTGTKNSYAKVLENCRKLIAAKLPLRLKSVAFKPLMNDIPDLKKFVEEELGVPFKFDTKIDPSIYGDQYFDLRPSPEEAVALEAKTIAMEAMRVDMEHLLKLGQAYAKAKPASQLLYRCGAGKVSYYIDYAGRVHTCSTGRLNEENFNLKEMTFKEIWEEHLPRVISEEARDKNLPCRTCEYRDICDTCPATAKLANGSKDSRPMYICQHTMARKKVFLDSKKETNIHG